MPTDEHSNVMNGSRTARRPSKTIPTREPGLFDLPKGVSPAIHALHDQILKVAKTQATVLIVGESGTGKELVARGIHEKSVRHDQPFVPVNCGAIPASLIEAELFGHEKGSFTGASQQNIGYFEHASDGTIFLDEVTEMAPDMQIKLLRVLETGVFHRVGGQEAIKVDVRVVAATNRDPYAAVRDRLFREDLLYRLAVVPLRVPPLREREGDVQILAQHFLDHFNKQGKSDKRFAPGAIDALVAHAWPGNIRELKNTVHRAFILADHAVRIGAFTSSSTRSRKPVVQDGHLNICVGTPLAQAQREFILATLAHCNDDKKQTASTLGISLKTLYNRLGAYQEGGDAAPG
jgi:DNA-binding NtrC family response regulator